MSTLTYTRVSNVENYSGLKALGGKSGLGRKQVGTDRESEEIEM